MGGCGSAFVRDLLLVGFCALAAFLSNGPENFPLVPDLPEPGGLVALDVAWWRWMFSVALEGLGGLGV